MSDKTLRPRMKVDFTHHEGFAGDEHFLLQLKLNGDTIYSTLVSRNLPFKWFRLWFWKRVLLYKFVNTLYRKGYIKNPS